MWTLFGSRGSGSAAVEMALDRCGLPYQVVRASTWEPDSAQADLQRLNPLGQIPTLLDPAGQVLTESAAILIQLGLSHPQSGLLPGDEAERAQALRGLVFIASNCYSAIGLIDHPERWCAAGDAAAHEAIRAGARSRLHCCWEVFADTVGGMDFFVQADPGGLQFLTVVVSGWSGARAHLRQVRPDFSAVLDRLDAHPSISPVLLRHRSS